MRYFSIYVGAANGDSPIDMPLDQDEDPEPIVVRFTVYDLPEETRFVVVTVYNTEGFESGYSNEVSTGETVGGGGGGVR